jgi:biotin carboxylase
LLDADWPRDAIDEVHAMPDLQNREHVIHGVSFLARRLIFDIIVALDDFDVEMAATLREHLRLPGMGESTARRFRDKLAMRMRAKDLGIRVPEFIHVLNHDRLSEFLTPDTGTLGAQTALPGIGDRDKKN